MALLSLGPGCLSLFDAAPGFPSTLFCKIISQQSGIQLLPFFPLSSSSDDLGYHSGSGFGVML